MIVAFDLDDTLYPEIDYVRSGFAAVAQELHREHGVASVESLEVMTRSLQERGRGRQFDDVLDHWGLLSRDRVRRLLSVYRQHDPAITLPAESRDVLATLESRWPLYLVTDGNHRVQQRKVDALGISESFQWCYYTNRYGREHAKPSTRVFELMLRREGVDPSELVYVGDNPAKDFVGVRRLGGQTVRVLTGTHREAEPRPAHEADACVRSIGLVLPVLERFAH